MTLWRLAGDAKYYPEAQGIVQKVHELGVVHDDLRQDNFLIGELNGTCRLWLIDFGNSFLSEDELDHEEEQERPGRDVWISLSTWTV